MMNIKTVVLEIKNLDDSKKQFSLEHANNIMKIQEKSGRHDWVISEGQNLTVQNGSIRPVKNTRTTTKETEESRD